MEEHTSHEAHHETHHEAHHAEPAHETQHHGHSHEPTHEQSYAHSHTYAGFWIRLVAYLIDGFILGIIARIFFGSAGMSADGTFEVGFSGLQVLVPIVYVIGFWAWQSATPGKMALGLKIVDEHGKNLDIKTALIRYLGYIVSGIILGIGFIMIGFTDKKQGLHDKIAKTFVIKKK